MSDEASRIILLFVDGLGVGANDPSTNPLAGGPYPSIGRLSGGSPLTDEATGVDEEDRLYRTIDATLNVEGLPQSGTGQATLFTGVNCAQIAGRHYGPFPHTSSRPVIREQNLFKAAEDRTGRQAIFANAYPQRFFRYIERTSRWTVTTYCCAASGVPLRTGEDLQAGRAVSADITGRSWPEPGPEHRIITPEEAGRRLILLSNDAPLVVFEYFATDKAGHEQSFEQAAGALERLDGLIAGVLDAIAGDQTLVLTSDHGNLEDLSVRTHTRNPIPLAAYGRAAGHFRGVDGLASVKSAVLSALGGRA